MSLTPSQLQAIAARGDTLVMAGAGTGKTHTLVETCARRLLDEREDIGIDEILMVTFTEAAAAEIRQRIRARLEREWEQHPARGRLQAQLAGLDAASISTLHSFCLRLLREHFHELAIDPDMTVLAEEQSALLASETLDALFEHHYGADTPESEAVRRFLREQTRGWEDRARDLILEIHHFTQTRPDPAGWFREQLDHYAEPEPAVWRLWLGRAFLAWRAFWLPVLAEQDAENRVAHACLDILQSLPIQNTNDAAPPKVEQVTGWAGEIIAQDTPDRWPKGRKTALRKPLEKMFEEAAFLHALSPSTSGGDAATDPLAEDWNWVREPMTTLLHLAREFGKRFAQAKRERGGLDFHDLEQMALRLLWDAATRQPTALARQWRENFKLVFVDEYQDINEAQDAILRALSREGDAANRFLVGDIKQSIYRFRQAAPRIFQNYARLWAGPSSPGRAIFLQENFRSRERILQFVNAFFAVWMREEMGGVAYDDQARLHFGFPEGRQPLAADPDGEPRVEVLLHFKGTSPSDESDASDGSDGSVRSEAEALTGAEWSETEAEAGRIAQRLRALRENRHPVWDTRQQAMRPVEWRDMVILLRSPKAKVESYAKVFAQRGIPLEAKRTGFFDSIEVRDLLNLLSLLDNPLQDLPAVAVLRSPLGGLSVDDLARVRLAAPKVRYWTALRAWHRETRDRLDGTSSPPQDPAPDPDPAERELFGKVDDFLRRFDRWRAQARHASLSQRLEMVLEETHYLHWLLTQDRGEQRQANVRQLTLLAREFDELHAQGLHRFLKMIEAQKEAAGDREPAPLETGQAVRLMSIHQSKGLEFPVVVVADLGKRFNLTENRHGLVLDETLGLCPQVRPPQAGPYYPSLPLWMAKQRRRAEALGEEMRILYVAMTRAQDTLILSGACAESTAREKWPERADAAETPRALLRANSYLDWLGPWLTASAETVSWMDQPDGQTTLWKWHLATPAEDEPGHEPAESLPEAAHDGDAESESAETINSLRAMLDWKYPYGAATLTPAKTSVTALRRQWSTADEEAAPARFIRDRGNEAPRPDGALDAGETGLAHHKFLEWVRLDHAGDVAQLRREADRLRAENRLSAAERDVLDLAPLAAFWQSRVGRAILASADQVEREMPFTCRLSLEDAAPWSDHSLEAGSADDFLVVQGVADLVVMKESEIWILDFKTDRFPKSKLPEKVAAYAPQLHLYGLALQRIHGKPVTRRWLHFLSCRHTEEIGQRG